MSKKPNAPATGNTQAKSIASDEFYTKIIVSPYKRRAMMTYVFIGFCLFLSLVFNNLLGGRDWLVILGPVVVIGLIMTLIPKSEEWEYKAWQSQPRQIERHQVERK